MIGRGSRFQHPLAFAARKTPVSPGRGSCPFAIHHDPRGTIVQLKQYLSGARLFRSLKTEFKGYNAASFQKDLLAGITVAAVALPLALAFGVASGATAAAGLVTAIVGGTVIAVLGGSPFQIAGPTGAMSAVLIVVASRYGLEGVWTVALLGGFLLLLMGIFRLGQIINFLPSAVITGFTSGISVIIFVGQIGNLLGIDTAPGDNSVAQLWNYIQAAQTPNGTALAVSGLVIAIMLFWPAKLNARFPGSLLSLIVAGALSIGLDLDVPTIGHIPQTILLEERLGFGNVPWGQLGALFGPAVSVAVLGAVESLLSGAVLERQTGVPFDPIQHLLGQGVGNVIAPFFGGVPATAAIARSSVAVRSGAVTRLAGVLHGGVLLAAALTLGPVISKVPLAALGGVLAVTAWRANDWAAIRDITRRRFGSEILTFAVTLLGTAAFDLTQAIVIGLGFSALLFVFQSSNTEVLYRPVSIEGMRRAGYELRSDAKRIHVVYVVGPLFFGTVHKFNTVMRGLDNGDDIILSLRTVPLLDTSGLSAIEGLIDRLESEGRRLYLSGLATPVRDKLERGGVIAKLGENRVFWSADQAIVAADRIRAEEAGPVA